MKQPVNASQTTSVPALQGVDHIHLYVPDKNVAARWYADNLGFRVDERFREWDTESGPLVIRDEGNTLHLALFARAEPAPISAVAFGTDNEGFKQWLEHLQARGLQVQEADHGKSLSIYFSDPWGNAHEITTYPEQ